MQKRFQIRQLFPFAVILAVTAFAVGCKGEEAGPKQDAAAVDTGKQMRTLFDGAHGDYDALSAQDHAAFVKLFAGDEKRAKEVWTVMKNGSSPRMTGSGVPQ